MMRLLFSFLVIVQLLGVGRALAAEAPIPPAPTQWVTDTAGFLSPGARDTLNQQLRAYERQSGHQIIAWIGKTTGDIPIEDWAVRAFEKWRIGRKGLDDGIAMIIMAEDRKIRIEVGYGLEGKVPDITANQVIQDIMVPRIRAGDRDGAVVAGVSRLVGAIEGQAPMPRGPTGGEATRAQRPMSLGQMIFLGLAGLVFFILFLTNPGLALYLLFSVFSGGRGGGSYSGGGGGFSGGGGRSGGGGATGSW